MVAQICVIIYLCITMIDSYTSQLLTKSHFLDLLATRLLSKQQTTGIKGIRNSINTPESNIKGNFLLSKQIDRRNNRTHR